MPSTTDPLLLETLRDLRGDIAKLDARLDSIDCTAVRQQLILEDHVRRSKANEKAVEILSTQVLEVKADVDRVKFLGKVAGWLGSVGFALYEVYQTLKSMGKF